MNNIGNTRTASIYAGTKAGLIFSISAFIVSICAISGLIIGTATGAYKHYPIFVADSMNLYIFGLIVCCAFVSIMCGVLSFIAGRRNNMHDNIWFTSLAFNVSGTIISTGTATVAAGMLLGF